MIARSILVYVSFFLFFQNFYGYQIALIQAISLITFSEITFFSWRTFLSLLKMDAHMQAHFFLSLIVMHTNAQKTGEGEVCWKNRLGKLERATRVSLLNSNRRLPTLIIKKDEQSTVEDIKRFFVACIIVLFRDDSKYLFLLCNFCIQAKFLSRSFARRT